MARTIQLNPKIVMLITLLTVFAFIGLVQSSFSIAYAPSKAASITMTYGLYLFLTIPFLIVFSVRKATWNGGKSIFELQGPKRSVIGVMSLLLFMGLMVFCLHRVLAYPTLFFANSYSTKEFKCLSMDVHGKRRRGLLKIEAVSLDGKEHLSFPWPTEKSPSCEKVITVSGYSWYWGTYITSVKNKDQ